MGFKELCPGVPHSSVRVAKIPRFFFPQVIKARHFVAVCTNNLTLQQWQKVATAAGEPSRPKSQQASPARECVDVCYTCLACKVDITSGGAHWLRPLSICISAGGVSSTQADKHLVWIQNKYPDRLLRPVTVVSLFMNVESTVVDHENSYGLGSGDSVSSQTTRCLWAVLPHPSAYKQPISNTQSDH
jgi:hypothetical protein